MTTSSLIVSNPTKPHNSTNQLTQSILLKRRLWNTAKSKSYSNSPRFKKALTRVYAQADWMARQGYGALPPYGKDAYLSEVMADACQGGF